MFFLESVRLGFCIFCVKRLLFLFVFFITLYSLQHQTNMKCVVLFADVNDGHTMRDGRVFQKASMEEDSTSEKRSNFSDGAYTYIR